MAPTIRVAALAEHHDRSGFASGSDALDRYFKTQASQDIRRRIATCFVALTGDTSEIVGYYTLAATNIALTDLSPSTVKKLPRYPAVPAALLGRLAVANTHQGKGLGGVLLADAITRSARAELGIFAIVVDAKDEGAQRFYEHFGFTLLPGAGRRLMLPINEALRAITQK